MDSKRFDRLAKSLSTIGTRRGLLRVLAALPLAGAIATVVGDEEETQAQRPVSRVQRRAERRRLRRHRRDPRHDSSDKDRDGERIGKEERPYCPAGADTCATGSVDCVDSETCFCMPKLDGSGSACIVGIVGQPPKPHGCNCTSDAACEALARGASCVAVTSVLQAPCTSLPFLCPEPVTSICGLACRG